MMCEAARAADPRPVRPPDVAQKKEARSSEIWLKPQPPSLMDHITQIIQRLCLNLSKMNLLLNTIYDLLTG